MALNKSRDALILMRREVVAGLRARGLTEREIAEKLPKLDPPIVDPDTGEAFSHVTIHTDCVANKRAWRSSANAKTAEHIARQLAELTEAKRAAFESGDLKAWATLAALEIKLLGTAAPDKVAPTDPTGEKPYESLTDAERMARLTALADKARTRATGQAANDTGEPSS